MRFFLGGVRGGGGRGSEGRGRVCKTAGAGGWKRRRGNRAGTKRLRRPGGCAEATGLGLFGGTNVSLV